ncbi:MAG: alpha/beta fold hydrolase [Candidatus Shapirobacteria bacterium]|nr:alpha/beta fold hydrolase [Candidatus Shapirobacteria bacterium]
MSESKVIQVETPKKYILDGLLLGPKKTKTVFIFIHGLGDNLFSQMKLADSLVSKNNSVIVFNNRGFGTINRIKKINKKSPKGYENITGGFAHEVFTDCVDDIDGAVNYALNIGAKEIILAGHSTGCQKSIYYLSKRQKTKVSGAILLAPMSDFADMFALTEAKKYKKLIATAKHMVKNNKSSELMPTNLWPIPTDAQRFLSLFLPESVEEIFSYASGKEPKILKSVKKPLLVILAGNDEHRDRPIIEISTWFKNALIGTEAEIKIINQAPHNFMGHVSELKKTIKRWLITY